MLCLDLTLSAFLKKCMTTGIKPLHDNGKEAEHDSDPIVLRAVPNTQVMVNFACQFV